MTTQWYYGGKGHVVGPMSFDEVAKNITQARNATHLVWSEGMNEWADARTVSEFKALYPSGPPPLPVLPKSDPKPAAPNSDRENDKSSQKTVVIYKTASNAGVVVGILGCFFALLGIFTIGLVFLPFAVLFSAISLLRSLFSPNAAGIATAFISIVLTIVGFATSPAATIAALAILGGLIGPSRVEQTSTTVAPQTQ